MLNTSSACSQVSLGLGMLPPVVVETTAHRPMSRPKPHSGGSTASQKLRERADQSRPVAVVGAAGALGADVAAFWLLALVDVVLAATVFIAFCAATGAASNGE